VTKSAGFASLDPGVVPASGCIDQSVAGMDAAQWDFMLVNPPRTLPEGLVASPMLASATGPFTFRICNIKGSSIDPPQGVGSHCLRRQLIFMHTEGLPSR